MVSPTAAAAMVASMPDTRDSPSAERPFILGLIPARGGSKGIPRKNIRPLAGRPLIRYTCDAAGESRRLSHTIVSTDDPAIADEAVAGGIEAPFLRPAELAGDATPSRDVIRHALGWWREHRTPQPGIVVLLQPTAPLRTADDVDAAIDLLLADPRADAAVSVTELPLHDHPAWQLVVGDDGALRLYDGGPLSGIVTRRQDLAPTYTRNGAVYAFRRSTFEATGGFYGERCLACVMPAERSVNLDTLDDWAAAERLLAGGGSPPRGGR